MHYSVLEIKNSTKSNVVYGNILGKKGSEIIEKNVLRHVLPCTYFVLPPQSLILNISI